MWHVLQVRPKKEQRAIRALIEKKFEYYCPEIKINTRKGQAIELMFPGYIFVDIAKDGPFHEIKYIPESHGLIRFSEYPLPISQSVIDGVKQQAEVEDADYLKEGDKVKVLEGPFKDCIAFYKCRNGRERVNILMKVCGSYTNIALHTSSVEKFS